MVNSIPSVSQELTLEAAVSFGEQSQLTGVYTPASVTPAAKNASAPCALFLTAGLLHHIGPTRLHVELARRLSAEGVPALRFDLSGVGESEASSEGADFTDRSVVEIQSAMSFLQSEYQHDQFVVIGLCSGADDGLAAVRQDQRIVGMVQLNGYAYKAGWFMLHRVVNFYLPRLLVKEKLFRLMQKVIDRFRFDSKSSATSAIERQALQDLDDDYRYIPSRKESSSVLQKLAGDAVDMLFVYTGSEHDDYTYKSQFFAMYPGLRKNQHVQVEYLKPADHTLMLEEDRLAVQRWVVQWYRAAAFTRKIH